MPTYTDALERTIDAPSPPRRIVSLVPSLTEALYAFGAGDRIVGITRFCVEPADRVAGVEKVGGTKDVDTARIIELQPDLVVANVEENTRGDIDLLVAAGVTVFTTYPRTVAAAIDELGTLLEIVGSTHADTQSLDEARAAVSAASPAGPAVRVFCPIWRRPWMTIGPDTYIHDLLQVCGGENVYADAAKRYPEITLADARSRSPEVVLLPDEPYPFHEKHRQEVIDSMGPVRIYMVDGKDLCWYGPRISRAIASIRSALSESETAPPGGTVSS